jgi:mono/diheme cytochrome c family protein
MKNYFKLGVFALLATLELSCTKPPQRPLSEIEQRGQALYLSNCIACHNPNPKTSGSLGPEVAGASLILLEKRILEGSYPEGYLPKRKTKMMLPLTHLKDDIPALYAYLNSFK